MKAFLEERESGLRYEIEEDVVVVGRNGDLAIPDPTLSRRHFSIRCEDGGFIVEDIGSAGGTFIDGARCTGPTRLEPHQTIQVGRRVFSIVVDEGPRKLRRMGPWLAFAPLSRTQGFRAINAEPIDGTRRFDVIARGAPMWPLPDHPSVPRFLSHEVFEDGAMFTAREEVAGPSVQRVVNLTRRQSARIPEAAAILIVGEIAGALYELRSLMHPPNVALSLDNIVLTWEGRVRVLAFEGVGGMPRFYVPASHGFHAAMHNNGHMHDAHLYALGCVALELAGHNVAERGPNAVTEESVLHDFGRRCALSADMLIDHARQDLIALANQIGFYPAQDLAALVRGLFPSKWSAEQELREELAMLDEDVIAKLL